MERRYISSGSKFEAEWGYSRAVVDGDYVYVSGTTGYDYKAGTLSPDVVEQARQTFRNIAEALKEAGSSLDEVVRVNYYLPDRADWVKVGPVLKEHLGKARPAATAVFAGLVAPEMKIEIEVTARRPTPSDDI